MRTVPDETDPNPTADRRRIGMIVAAAVALPTVLMLVGSTSHPELGFVVIALVFPALWIVGTVRRRRSLEATDERARHIRQRAGSFSWQVMAVVLTVTTGWIDLRYGIRAAEPYLLLLAGFVVSYLAALLWQHWRGV
jgi:hypothetical protein